MQNCWVNRQCQSERRADYQEYGFPAQYGGGDDEKVCEWAGFRIEGKDRQKLEWQNWCYVQDRQIIEIDGREKHRIILPKGQQKIIDFDCHWEKVDFDREVK